MMSWSSIHAMTLTVPPQRLQTSISMLKTRLSLWAQVIAARRSAGDLPSALERGGSVLPRLAGVTKPRHRWFGRAAQDKDAMVRGLKNFLLHLSLNTCRWR